MKKIRTLLSSIVFLIISIVILEAIALGAIFPISDFVMNHSESTTTNFYLSGGMLLLLGIATVVETLLVVRLVWGAGTIVGKYASQGPQDENDIAEMKSMKLTGAKKAAVFGVLLAANVIGFDQMGHGVMISATRRYHVLTQLRAGDEESVKQAVQDSIQLVGDEAVANALIDKLDKPGEKEWIAYALGVRQDKNSRVPLRNLMVSGNGKEKAAAAVALARLKDPSLLGLAVKVYSETGDLKKDILIALGMLGRTIDLDDNVELDSTGAFLVEQLEDGKLDAVQTRLAIWALGELRTPKGLPYLKSLLSPKTDTTTLCITLEALGKISEAASCDNMMALVPKVDKKAYCEETVAADFTGHQVLLAGGLNLVHRIIREIANIGDTQQLLPMERLAKDESYSETIRKTAEEIAFQMRFGTPMSN